MTKVIINKSRRHGMTTAQKKATQFNWCLLQLAGSIGHLRRCKELVLTHSDNLIGLDCCYRLQEAMDLIQEADEIIRELNNCKETKR